MRIVFYSITDPSSQESIEQHEVDAEALIDSDDGSCVDVTSGETMDPSVKPCYTLIFDQSSDDSKYIINTEGLTGFVAFAQHVPIEFERDMHYLQDSAGTDIEPVLQEGAEGHDHSHGHGHDKAEYEKCACAAEKFNFAIDCRHGSNARLPRTPQECRMRHRLLLGRVRDGVPHRTVPSRLLPRG